MATLSQITAGQIRHRVTFYKRTSTNDGAGNYEAGFGPVEFQRRARITPLAGGEEVTGARLQGVQPAIIRVRSDSSTRGVTAGWQLVDVTEVDGKANNVAYNITAIRNPDEKNIWIEFMCTSGKPG